MNYNTDTARAYNHLRAAVVDYISNESTYEERANAYADLLAHIKRGPLPVPMDQDALAATEDDYAATIDGFLAGTR